MHTLMSFAGSVGALMANSGLENILQTAFGGVAKNGMVVWSSKMANPKLSTAPELKSLPSITDAFELHVYRTHYQAVIWLINGSDPPSWRDSETPDDQSMTFSLSPLSCTTPTATPSHTPTPQASCPTMTGGGSELDNDLTYTVGVTESTPYACQFCDKAFSRLSFLKRHEQKSDRRKWTWEMPGNRAKNQVDYILVNRHTNLTNVEVLNRVTGSDHRMVRATICINVKSDRTKLIMTRHISVVATQDQIDQYRLELTNSLQVFAVVDEDIDQANSQLIKTMKDAAKKANPTCNQSLNKFSATTLSLMNRRNDLIIRNSEDLLEKRDLNKTIHKRQRTETRAYNQRIVETTIKEGKGYTTAKKRLAIGNRQIASLKNADGEIVTDREEILRIGERFYQTLYTSSLNIHPTYSFSEDEEDPIPDITRIETHVLTHQTPLTETQALMSATGATLPPTDIQPSSAHSHGAALPGEEGQMLQCLHCGQVHELNDLKYYGTPMEMDLSKSRMLPTPKLFCSYCPKGISSFLNLESLQMHIQLAHGALFNGDHIPRVPISGYDTTPVQQRPGFACQMCTLKFPSVQMLQKHTLTAHSFKDMDTEPETESIGETYCSQCKESFSDNNSLLDHIRNVHEVTGDDGSVSNGFNSSRQSESPQVEDLNRTSVSPCSPHSQNQTERQNTSRSTLLCNQCKASFDEFESFRAHLKSHLDQSMRQQRYACQECKAEFNSEEQLDNHATSHYLSSSTEYGCQCCMKLFVKPDELQKHLMDLHAHHLFRCSLCRQVFDSKVSIQVHFAVKHSNECQLFKCNLCGTLYRSEMESHLHVKVAHLHKAKPYRCLFCNHSFSSEMELQCHLTTHKKQFSCKLCDEAFHVEFLLDKHMTSKHSQQQQETPLTLQTEPIATSSSSLMPPISSSVSVFPSDEGRKALDLNTTEENDGQDVKCDICDTTFQSNSQLTSHRKQVHNVTRANGHQTLSLHCAYCNESCKSRTELENHMKTHTATTSSKHKCNVCDELCPSATILAEHKLQHCKVLTSSLCVICKNTIRNDQQFYSHIHQHHGTGYPTSCVICRQTLSSEVEIQVHSKFHLKNSGSQTRNCDRCSMECEINKLFCETLNEESEGSSLYTCRDCHEQLKMRPSSSNSDKKQDLRCSECSVKFETVAELDKHRAKHNKKTYQCIKCQLSFDTEAEIQMHVTTHLMTEGSHHECQLCPNVFISPAKLQCHLIEHTYEGCSNFTCYMCSAVFTSSHAIQQHMLEHGLASRPYDCHQCHQKFFFRCELENHSYSHRPKYKTSDSKKFPSEMGTNFQCDQCPRTFSNSLYLNNHLKIHETPTSNNINNNQEDIPSPIRCSQCPKTFSSSVELQQHYFTTHSDVDYENNTTKKTFQCLECDKQFPCLSNWQGHMRIHTQGTKFVCPKCSKEFALSRNLNIHMRSHSGEKPYGCHLCEKRFARKENRKAHLKSHSGQKPFMCPHCAKSFSRKCHVKEHMKVHFNTTGNGSPALSSCEECSQTFMSVDLLKRHLKETHHKEAEESAPHKAPKQQHPQIYVLNKLDFDKEEQEMTSPTIFMDCDNENKISSTEPTSPATVADTTTSVGDDDRTSPVINGSDDRCDVAINFNKHSVCDDEETNNGTIVNTRQTD
ncbi:Zinc finger protein 423 [Nymphon striatum]|nr:Zinc finger protein 423 [Nymphon striatum]